MKLTVLSLVVLFLITAFSGVEPMNSYKNIGIKSIEDIFSYINNQQTATTPTATIPLQQKQQESSPSSTINLSEAIDTIKSGIANNTDASDYANIFNQYRQSKGLAPLQFTDDLNRIASLAQIYHP